MNTYLDKSCPNSITYLATFYLIIMLTQFLPFEGYEVSFFKIAAMAITPMFLILQKNGDGLKRVLPYASAYYVVLILCSLLFDEIVWERIIYRGLYIVTFVWFFCAINRGAFSYKYFVAFLGCFILVNGVVILLQQITMLFLGTHDMPIINLKTNLFNKSLSLLPRANGLAIEPSHIARIMTVCFFAYFRVQEIVKKEEFTIKQLYKEHPYVTIAYTYSMLSIGSATALMGFLLIFGYLVRRNLKILIFIIPFIILLLNLNIEFTPIQRLNAVFNSLFSDDVTDSLRKNEVSGFVRILPIINTVTNLDLFSSAAWIGQGSATVRDFHSMVFSNTTMIGDITNYGLITYIFSMIFVYKCCIRKFFSFETLLLLALLGFGIGSLYYLWGSLMLFTVIRYFEMNSVESEETNFDLNHENEYAAHY